MSGDGPIPKRSAERRRRNKVITDKATPPATGLTVEVPPADPSWHTLAVGWYESLKISGQSQFYEPSDWAAAQVAAWYITELVRKPSSVAFSAAWSAMGALLTTEGERRWVLQQEQVVVGVVDAERVRVDAPLQRPGLAVVDGAEPPDPERPVGHQA